MMVDKLTVTDPRTTDAVVHLPGTPRETVALTGLRLNVPEGVAPAVFENEGTP
jgi:hypothetical protein